MRNTLKDPQALDKMRRAGQLVARSFELLERSVRPGVSLNALDDLGVADFITENGAKALYNGYQGSSNDHPQTALITFAPFTNGQVKCLSFLSPTVCLSAG